MILIQYNHRYVTGDGLCHTLTILSNINTSYFFYGLAFPKASTIWLRNSSDTIGFPGKATELLSQYTFPIYFRLFLRETND